MRSRTASNPFLNGESTALPNDPWGHHASWRPWSSEWEMVLVDPIGVWSAVKTYGDFSFCFLFNRFLRGSLSISWKHHSCTAGNTERSKRAWYQPKTCIESTNRCIQTLTNMNKYMYTYIDIYICIGLAQERGRSTSKGILSGKIPHFGFQEQLRSWLHQTNTCGSGSPWLPFRRAAIFTATN